MKKTTFRIVFLSFLSVISFNVFSQTTISSLEELWATLDLDNQNIVMEPGEYNIGLSEVSGVQVIDGDASIFKFNGSNSTYDFTGVTFNFDTDIFMELGNNNVTEVFVNGSNIVLTNLTMVDIGDTRPRKTALGVNLSGTDNRVEGFNMTVRGSYPYGYGDLFGKGSGYIIKHFKHSAVLIKGERNHLKNTTIIHRSYGHGVFCQGSIDAVIEGVYLEGEVRTTDDVLAERGTGSAADEVDFMTVWGYEVPPGWMISLQEDGIRAYNKGSDPVTGVETNTKNMRVIDCTVKNMRSGVPISMCDGERYVENVTLQGNESGFTVGAGDVINCRADAAYGSAYDSEGGVTGDVTIIEPENGYYNGSNVLVSISGGTLTMRTEIEDIPDEILVRMGTYRSLRHQPGSTLLYQVDSVFSGATVYNHTDAIVELGEGASNCDIHTCGTVIDDGTNNTITALTDCEVLVPCNNTTELIEAECFDGMSGIDTEPCDEGGYNMGWIQNGDWAMYSGIDLSNMNSINARVSSKTTGSIIEVRLNAPYGELIGELEVTNTGGNQTWVTDSENITSTDGIHDIYFVFVGGTGYLYNINWFSFSEESIPLPGHTERFIHPGLSHKRSDLDRMKYQIEARIDPWYSAYQEMVADSKSSYDYEVQGDPSFTELGRDNKVNYGAWNSDIRAAYYNAIRWYVTGDERHAQKAVEIFNSWVGLTDVTSNGTDALSGGVGYIMIEAAEIIKHTYDGWASADIKAFEDMLVYPGYSTTSAPSGGTFYWKSYQGDPGRHGNQGLSGWRTVMAIGVFLDNEIIYDRALRYIKGEPHREDDLAYPSGPCIIGSMTNSTDYVDTYSTSSGSDIEDYGFNELMVNYIYENGQCQESSRDQQHVMFGIGLLTSMSEIAWNQGDNLYGFEDNRLLLGYEYNMKYNLSYSKSYPDQTKHWVPTVESGEFLEGFERTGRWYSKAISPVGIAEFEQRPIFELAVGHYLGRGIATEEEAKWLLRTRDTYLEEHGYENAGWTNDALGWGAITYRRPVNCYGDPIQSITDQQPEYGMHFIPSTIEAENYDHFIINGNGKTYFDTDSNNKGGEYRTDESVDIEVCSEGGYNLSYLADGEWLSYTVYVSETGTYDFAVNIASINEEGTIKFSINGEEKTAEVSVPNTGNYQVWQTVTIAEGVLLSQGVQNLKVHIGGSGFNLNSFTISESNSCVKPYSDNVNVFEAGVSYSYYEGIWDNIPDFSTLTPTSIGTVNSISLGADPAQLADGFAYLFEGYINIETEGEYTFYTSSDDGSNLKIDGVLIVNNDGTHGAVEESGSICLQEGFHKISIAYFEKSGGNALTASYSGPGITKTDLSSAVYVQQTAITQTISLVEGWNLVSLFVQPENNLTGTIFPNATIVKTFDTFYSTSQPDFLNTLTRIDAGVGYLVYNEINETIEISGVETHGNASLLDGWNLIGVQSSTPISVNDYTDAQIIKDFDSFYKKGDDFSTLSDMMPGKAYFILK